MTRVVQSVDAYTPRLTRLTLTWVLTALVLFPILAVLGFLMRILQAGFMASVPPHLHRALPRVLRYEPSSDGTQSDSAVER
jgi:hypothetical protein